MPGSSSASPATGHACSPSNAHASYPGTNSPSPGPEPYGGGGMTRRYDVAGTALGARQRGDIDVAYVRREVVAAVPRRNAPAGPVFSSTHPHRRRRRDQKTRPKTPGDPGSASGTVSGARGRPHKLCPARSIDPPTKVSSEAFVWFPASEMMMMLFAAEIGAVVSPMMGSYRGESNRSWCQRNLQTDAEG